MTGEATVMARRPGSVSPYLLRRLRSYHEALRDRLRRRRQRGEMPDNSAERPNTESGKAKRRRRPDSAPDGDV